MSDRIDLNHASRDEIQRLSGVGRGTADAIVSWRDEHGHFESLEDLDSVPRIDGQTIEKLRQTTEVRARRKSDQSSKEHEGKVDLNHAQWHEIAGLPGIGEKMADAILTYRKTHGEFKNLEELTKVSGIGRDTIERIRREVYI